MADASTPPAQKGTEQPRSPLGLEAPDWKETLRRTAAEFKADRAALISAGMAFYWFLAIFPALLAAVGVFGLVNAGPQATESLTKAIRTTLPGDAADVLSGAVSQAPSRGASLVAVVVGLALALWSASAGMVAVESGLDVAYDVPEERERKFVKKRLYALALMGVAAVLGGIATVLVVFGAPLGEIIRDDVPFGGAFVIVWTLVRWVLAVAAVAVLFAAFYYLGPNRESPRWSWLSPGGVIAALIWLASSLAFSFYVSSFGSYAKTYGSLAGVVVLLLWLYLSALAVVVGGELNAELERQAAIKRGQLDARGEARDEARAADGDAGEAVTAHERTEAVTSEWAERMQQLRNR